MRITISLPEQLVKKIDSRSPLEGRDSRSNTIASELRNLYQLERCAINELQGVFTESELKLMKDVVDAWEYSPVYNPSRLLGVEIKQAVSMNGLERKHKGVDVGELIGKIKGVGSFQAHYLIMLLRGGGFEEIAGTNGEG